MARYILSFLLGLGLMSVACEARAADTCLRPDRLKQISMRGADMALASDKDGHVYHLKFTGPCGARHVGVFFVLHTLDMQTCIASGTFLPTNREGACEVSSVKRSF